MNKFFVKNLWLILVDPSAALRVTRWWMLILVEVFGCAQGDGVEGADFCRDIRLGFALLRVTRWMLVDFGGGVWRCYGDIEQWIWRFGRDNKVGVGIY